MDIITLLTLPLAAIGAIIKYMVIPVADIVIAYRIIKRMNKKAESKTPPT